VPDESFAQWVDAARSAGPTLDEQAYVDLAKPSKAVSPFTYRAVAPNLFNRIVSSDNPSRLTDPASQRAER
jgi:cytochrome o ubiquinol oxidase subunit II